MHGQMSTRQGSSLALLHTAGLPSGKLLGTLDPVEGRRRLQAARSVGWVSFPIAEPHIQF